MANSNTSINAFGHELRHDEQYNGWTNYITWRIYLEWFSDRESLHDEYRDGDSFRSEIVMMLQSGINYFHWLDLNRINHINWDEIADAMNDSL